MKERKEGGSIDRRKKELEKIKKGKKKNRRKETKKIGQEERSFCKIERRHLSK